MNMTPIKVGFYGLGIVYGTQSSRVFGWVLGVQPYPDPILRKSWVCMYDIASLRMITPIFLKYIRIMVMFLFNKLI